MTPEQVDKSNKVAEKSVYIKVSMRGHKRKEQHGKPKYCYHLLSSSLVNRNRPKIQDSPFTILSTKSLLQRTNYPSIPRFPFPLIPVLNHCENTFHQLLALQVEQLSYLQERGSQWLSSRNESQERQKEKIKFLYTQQVLDDYQQKKHIKTGRRTKRKEETHKEELQSSLHRCLR